MPDAWGSIRPPIIRAKVLDYISLLVSRRREIAWQIRWFKPDVILGFQILSPYLAAGLAKMAKIPFIYYWTDVYHAQIPFRPYRSLGKLIEKRTIKMSDKVLSINEKLQDVTVGLGANPARTGVLGGSVDLKRFDAHISPERIRSQYGIGQSDLVLGFVGLFHKHLALEELVLGLAKDGNSGLKLLFVGEGDQLAPNKVPELSELARQAGVSDRVILTGRRPYQEVPEFMAAADICLLPAHPEEMMRDIVPIKLYEYLAMGKPVISTKLPGVMKEFGDDNGVVYANAPEDIISQAVELSANGGIDRLSARAKAFMEAKNWDSTTDEFEKILEEVAGELHTRQAGEMMVESQV